MPHIVFWSRLSFAKDRVLQHLSAAPDVQVSNGATLDACLEALPQADGLVLYNCAPPDARRLAEALHERAPKLAWMHFLTAGRDGFQGLALPAGVQVTGAAGSSAPVVAEHAMALLLALVRGLPAVLQQQQARRWDRALAGRFTSLEGRTLLIAGLGHIGREIARRASAFGVRTLGLNRDGRHDPAVDECLPLSALAEALPRSDFIVIALALTAETRRLFDHRAFAACRPGSYLVNVARGDIVDQAALREALLDGRLAGAGLDVATPEPLDAADPLWQAPNLILSPHVAVEGSTATAVRVADGMLAELRKRWPTPLTTQ
ncbi:MAG: D-2-hydroxyacid dehydrogenase [Rubrivivax sp.]